MYEKIPIFFTIWIIFIHLKWNWNSRYILFRFPLSQYEHMSSMKNLSYMFRNYCKDGILSSTFQHVPKISHYCIIIVNRWSAIIMLSGTMSYTLLKRQIQHTVKHMIGFSRKILTKVFLPYALKTEMKN